MALFGMGKKPTPEAPKPPEATGDDIRAALNDPKFTGAFLDEYRNKNGRTIELTNDNANEIKDLYQRFKEVNSVLREVQSVLREEVKAQTGITLSEADIVNGPQPLNDGEQKGAEAYLYRMVLEGDAKFDRIKQTIADYRDTKNALGTIRQEVKQRTESHQTNQASLTELKKVSLFKRVFNLGRRQSEQTAIDTARERGLSTLSVGIADRQVKKEGKELEGAITKQNTTREQFIDLKKDLVDMLGLESWFQEVVDQTLKNKFSPETADELRDEDIARYNELMEMDDTEEQLMDYTNSLQEGRGEFEKIVNAAAEKRVTDALKTAIERVPHSSNQYNSMENAIGKFLKIEAATERIGTKSQAESRDFIVDFLQTTYAEYTQSSYKNDPEKSTKSYLIARVLIQNGIDPQASYKPKQSESNTASLEPDQNDQLPHTLPHNTENNQSTLSPDQESETGGWSFNQTEQDSSEAGTTPANTQPQQNKGWQFVNDAKPPATDTENQGGWQMDSSQSAESQPDEKWPIDKGQPEKRYINIPPESAAPDASPRVPDIE